MSSLSTCLSKIKKRKFKIVTTSTSSQLLILISSRQCTVLSLTTSTSPTAMMKRQFSWSCNRTTLHLASDSSTCSRTSQWSLEPVVLISSFPLLSRSHWLQLTVNTFLWTKRFWLKNRSKIGCLRGMNLERIMSKPQPCIRKNKKIFFRSLPLQRLWLPSKSKMKKENSQ